MDLRIDNRRNCGDAEATPASLLFEIETDEQASCRPSRSTTLWMSACLFSMPQTRFEERLLHDVRYYKTELTREEGQVDIVVLASHLATIGYRVALRTAVGGGTGQKCFRNLCYQFLLVMAHDSPVQYIVDPKFREQFVISQTTRDYDELLDLVPPEFIGTTARLRPLVKLLCIEMEQAFQERDLTWPPWRQADSMLSKWLPSKSQDMQIDSPASSPRADRKIVPGRSPSGPLSYCSSRASSAAGHLPESPQPVLPRRSVSHVEPRRVQKGFSPCEPQEPRRAKSEPASRTRDWRKTNLPAAGFAEAGCASNATLSSKGSMGYGRQRAQGFSMDWQPQIRTVKMAGVG